MTCFELKEILGLLKDAGASVLLFITTLYALRLLAAAHKDSDS